MLNGIFTNKILNSKDISRREKEKIKPFSPLITTANNIIYIVESVDSPV